MKTLGIYYATACYRDEQGRYYTSNGLGRYLDALRKVAPSLEVTLIAPTTYLPRENLGYPIAHAVHVYELPYFEKLKQAMLLRRDILTRIAQASRELRCEVFWIRYPGAYGDIFWQSVRRRGTKCFFEIVGDPLSIWRNRSRANLLVKYLAIFLSWYHNRHMKAILKNVPAFAVSSFLASNFGANQLALDTIMCGTLVDDDFYFREDTCNGERIRILFVGEQREDRLLDVLIRATAILQRREVPVQLHLVGDGSERKYLEALAESSLQPGSYYFHGHISDPHVLHRHYQEADIFVMCPATEGLGRVVGEAMARGVPVVATRVGGIPDMVKDDESGLLVEPRNVEQLANAMLRIIQEPALRRKLISNGYAVAKNLKGEVFIERVLRFVEERVL